MNRLIGLLFSYFLLVACNTKKEEETPQQATTLPPQYYYFPKANIYVDSANMDFLFVANDGKTWQTAKQIPVAMQAMMDKNILIENPSQPVWKDNENHRLVYSALLYATASDTARIVPPKPEATPSKPAEDTVKEEVKERKGLRKFFDKIFGRNKKDKRNNENNEH